MKQGRDGQPPPEPAEPKQKPLPIAAEKDYVHVPAPFVAPPSMGTGFTSKTARRETLFAKQQREAKEKPALDQQRSVLVRQIRERSLDDDSRKR